MDCVECNVTSKLRAKPYLRSNEFAQQLGSLKVLSIGDRDITRLVCGDCIDAMRYYKLDAAAAREIQCGKSSSSSNDGEHLELSVLQVVQPPSEWNEQAVEEIGIRIRGETSWAKPMRPSGPFSSLVIGRSFGRDTADSSQRPHAVIVSSAHPCEQLEQLRRECADVGIPIFVLPVSTDDVSAARILRAIMRSTSQRLKSDVIERWASLRYSRGVADGMGLATATAAAVAAQQSSGSDSECEARVRQAYQDGWEAARRSVAPTAAPYQQQQQQQPAPQ